MRIKNSSKHKQIMPFSFIKKLITPTPSSLRNRKTQDLMIELSQINNKNDRLHILLELITRQDHHEHEDIVFELGLIANPIATSTIEEVTYTLFKNLEEWGNTHAFQRKCAYALANIGTKESRLALEKMANHSDPEITRYGIEGLEHWKNRSVN